MYKPKGNTRPEHNDRPTTVHCLTCKHTHKHYLNSCLVSLHKSPLKNGEREKTTTTRQHWKKKKKKREHETAEALHSLARKQTQSRSRRTHSPVCTSFTRSSRCFSRKSAAELIQRGPSEQQSSSWPLTVDQNSFSSSTCSGPEVLVPMVGGGKK